ncbi:MAG: diguanylate cyclase [Gemmatimonadota bacterium]
MLIQGIRGPMIASDSNSMTASPAERYRVLLEIGRALTGTLRDEELYAAIYRETARVIEADGFYVSLYDVASDEATVVFWADAGRGSRAQIVYPGSESPAIRTGEPTMVSDHLREQSLLVIGDRGDRVTRSAISAPMRARGRILGVISAQSYRPRAYTRSDLELLEGIADLAAVASENVSHVAELEQRRREAEKMEGIVRALVSSLDVDEVLARVAEVSLDLLEADGAVVWLLEEESARVAASQGPIAPEVGARFPLEGELGSAWGEQGGRGLPDDRAENHLLSEELKKHLRARSALVAPLTFGERVTGALSVGVAHARAFGREESHLLQRLAGHASVALHNARLHAGLQALSLTDPLTGLPNRRHLELHLGQELAAARRGRTLSVVLFDLDNFKQYNDTLGHLAGDEVLSAMGEVLGGETRAMNLVARYGGDEFLSVLSDTSLEGARQHARRVEERVARHPALGPIGITVSAGVATFGEGSDTVKDLIRAADEDMYRSKAQKSSR